MTVSDGGWVCPGQHHLYLAVVTDPWLMSGRQQAGDQVGRDIHTVKPGLGHMLTSGTCTPVLRGRRTFTKLLSLNRIFRFIVFASFLQHPSPHPQAC